MSEYRMMPNDWKGGGVIRFMAEAEGYVMARRPNCLPFLITKEKWDRCEPVEWRK